jgi:hypothetical protein
MKYLMACGHVSNAVDENGDPVCVICIGRHSGAKVPVKECDGRIGLDNRQAICVYCGKAVDSSWELPFFEYKPEKEYDSYYSGCMGWD